MQDNRYIILDIIRVIAAVMVCLGHLRAALFVNYSQVNDTNIFYQFFYFITGFGHESVVVFFVLSGFLVGGSILKRNLEFCFSTYIIARLSRLWVVLLPALIFTLIIDHFSINNLSLIFSGDYSSSLNSGPNGTYSTSLQTFLGNIFFLQTIYEPVFGSNGPLWSLSNEFWYYLMFPLIIIGIKHHRIKVKLAYLSTLLIITVLILPSYYLVGFSAWLMGTLVYWVNSNLQFKDSFFRKKYILKGSVLFLILALCWSRLIEKGNIVDFLSDWLLSIPISIFLITSLANRFAENVSLKKVKYITLMSDMSYTLYLFHFPIIMFVFSLLTPKEGLQPSLFNMLFYVFILFIILIISFVAWYLFERNTNLIKKALLNFLAKKRKA